MSQEAYDKYEPELPEDGILLIEQDIVVPVPLRGKQKMYGISAIRLAEEVGRKIVLNIVMIGFFASVTNIIEPEAIRNAVLDSVPKGTEELNTKAFDKGYEHGKQLRDKEKVK